MQPIQETANATEIAKSLSGKEKLQEGIFRVCGGDETGELSGGDVNRMLEDPTHPEQTRLGVSF